MKMKKLQKRPKVASQRKKKRPLGEAGNKRRFEQLLDDAVLGVKRR